MNAIESPGRDDSHDHGDHIRCLECITDAEWGLIPDPAADMLAEASNWVPAQAVQFDLRTGELTGGERS